MFHMAAILGPAVYRKTLNITAHTEDWNLITDGFGGSAPTQKSIITINVASLIEVAASSTSVPAMDLTGLPANSKIILNNAGRIYGAGGAGGAGGGINVIDEPPFDCATTSTPGPNAGSSGGDAVSYDGVNVDLDINNTGLLFGGGGGGGGGNGQKQSGLCDVAGGGGGGGGSGGGASVGTVGAGGGGGVANNDGVPTGGAGSDGGDGNPGTGGGGGSGGAGGVDGTASGTAGGAGGSFGEAGTSSSQVGGAAGKAVANAGTGTTTFLAGGDPADTKGAVE